MSLRRCARRRLLFCTAILKMPYRSSVVRQGALAGSDASSIVRESSARDRAMTRMLCEIGRTGVQISPVVPRASGGDAIVMWLRVFG
jgi:hypothetical protein